MLKWISTRDMSREDWLKARKQGIGGSDAAAIMEATKFSSPLSVDDFVKKSQYTYYTEEALAEIKDGLMLFAEKEGLHGHARSVGVRFGEE